VVSFDEMNRRCIALNDRLERMSADEETLAHLRSLQADVTALRNAERGRPDKLPLPEYVLARFSETLSQHRIRSGVIAEIGGSKNSLLSQLPRFEARFLSIFPSDDPRYQIADISNCPHIPDNSFDAVFSISVLEHVRNIHDAAREITRILKPGGITMHAVPFSYFFHGAPQDYWRPTTTAMETLFEELAKVECAFYSENRRRNNLGSASNAVDDDGGPQFSADAFGGWRENWFTIYIGRKLPDGAQRLHDRRVKQAAIDVVKGLTSRGLSEDDAIVKTLTLIRHITFNDYGRPSVAATAINDGPAWLDAGSLRHLWQRRSKNTIGPSAMYHNLLAMIQAAGLL
jgi:SAM-dependent methyltransferase